MMRPIAAAWAAVVLVVAPLAAARPTPEQQLERLLAGRTAGKPQTCLPLRPTTDPTTIPHIGIVYDLGGTRYLSRFEGGCPQLDSDRVLVTRTPQAQICRGDIADVMSRPPPMFMGTCTFGEFVPYKKTR